MLCRPAGYDWIQASKPAVEDARTLNPGVLYEYQKPQDHSGNVDRGADTDDDGYREMTRDSEDVPFERRMSESQIGHDRISEDDHRLESVDEHSTLDHTDENDRAHRESTASSPEDTIPIS